MKPTPSDLEVEGLAAQLYTQQSAAAFVWWHHLSVELKNLYRGKAREQIAAYAKFVEPFHVHR